MSYYNALSSRRRRVTSRLAEMVWDFMFTGGPLEEMVDEDIAQRTGDHINQAKFLRSRSPMFQDISDMCQCADMDMGIIIRAHDGTTREFWPEENFTDEPPARKSCAERIKAVVTHVHGGVRTGGTIYSGSDKKGDDALGQQGAAIIRSALEEHDGRGTS